MILTYEEELVQPTSLRSEIIVISWDSLDVSGCFTTQVVVHNIYKLRGCLWNENFAYIEVLEGRNAQGPPTPAYPSLAAYPILSFSSLRLAQSASVNVRLPHSPHSKYNLPCGFWFVSAYFLVSTNMLFLDVNWHREGSTGIGCLVYYYLQATRRTGRYVPDVSSLDVDRTLRYGYSCKMWEFPDWPAAGLVAGKFARA